MTIDTSLTESKIQRVLNGFLSQPKYSVDGLYVFKWEFKLLYKVTIEGADYNSIERHVFMDVLEELGVNVKEKYKEIMDRAEQQYKERYPGRK